MESYMAVKQQAGRAMQAIGQTRELAEVQAQIFLAKQFPRDPQAALERILAECKNPKLAEQAQFCYTKGKGDKAVEVRGASIRLLEVIARNWGNCDSSLTEVERRGDSSTVKVRFWDFETNAQQSKTFDVHFIRNTKSGSYPVTDERERYEMMANYGARRLRACIQAGIPAWIVDEAAAVCDQTMRETVKNGRSIEETRASMLQTFQNEADWITEEMLGNVVDKPFDKLNEADIVRLRKLYNAIKEGFVNPKLVFLGEITNEQPPESGIEAEMLNEQLGL